MRKLRRVNLVSVRLIKEGSNSSYYSFKERGDI
jgi:hypothetical protein